jgi:iron complex outermembrane receptor protein
MTFRPARRLSPLAFFLALGLQSGIAVADETDGAEPGLEKLARSTLEELMQVKVTTVVGSPQSRLASPAAVYVISGDDLRRSGHRSVPEALRMVPGMYVARINSSSWLVGSRGLTGSSLTATRYLVLVDGRQVYDPLTSTTFWDTVDLLLEDVDRIEVIRGPGATLWGANAMNGVIHHVTRSCEETVGDDGFVGGGSLDRAEVGLRHGAALGDDAWYRVWAKYASHDDFETANGESIQDQWSDTRAGFRYDRQVDPATTLTVMGEAYTHPVASESVLMPVPGVDRQFQRLTVNADVSGASLLLRFNRGFGEASGWRLRAYADQTRREGSRFAVTRETADIDLRSWTHWGGRHDFMWGAEFLWTGDDVVGSPAIRFDPASRSWYQLNAFVQNTTELVPGKLYAMIGSKFTDHEFVGFQVQPNARIWWTPSPAQTLWASVSRPIRTPSRFEEDGTLVLSYADLGALTGGAPNGVIIPLAVTGDDSLRAEQLMAWELGHRWQPSPRFLVETALFYNDYRRLIEPAATILGAFTDAGSGRTVGVEINGSAQLTDHWRMEASYSWLEVAINGPVYPFEENSSPRHLAQLRSYLDIGDRMEVNGAVYLVASVAQANVDAYTRVDLGLSWRLGTSTRFELWGQNLLDDTHAEATGALVPRSLQARVTVSLGP